MRNLLIILGAARCGSTWLHNSLRAHSRIRCAADRIKEVSYFDTIYPPVFDLHGLGAEQVRRRRARIQDRNALLLRRAVQIEATLANIPSAHKTRRDRLDAERDRLHRFVDGFAESAAWYKAQFACEQRNLWALDSTPNYYTIDPRGFPFLLSAADNVVCVLLVRDPEDMLRSRLQNDVISRNATAERQQRQIEYIAGDYLNGVRQTLASIPASKLRVLAFDELVRRPVEIVRGLLESIGLQGEPECFVDAGVSPNASPRLDLAANVRDRLADVAREVRTDVLFADPLFSAPR